MPDDIKKTDATPEGDREGETSPAFNLDDWLKGIPDDAKAALKAKQDTEIAGLKSALDKERDANKALERQQRDAAKANQDAEQERLTKQGEFEELAKQFGSRADKAESKLAEVEPQVEALTETVKRYEKALKGQLEATRGELPEHITELLDTMDPVRQLEYLAKHREELTPTATPPGGPVAAPGRGQRPEATKEQRDRARRMFPR